MRSYVRLHQDHNTVGLTTTGRAFTEAAMGAAGKLLDASRATQPARPCVTAKPFTVRTVARPSPGSGIVTAAEFQAFIDRRRSLQ